MQLSGNFKELSVIEVIQLLAATKKTGILRTENTKRQSQLIFNAGYVIGSAHSERQYSIGRLLCLQNFITPQILEEQLKIQAQAVKRKPLVTMLVEAQFISDETATAALKKLIELILADMLSWTSGTFEFEVETAIITDKYQYVLEELEPIKFDTQYIIMEAFRIFEKKRNFSPKPAYHPLPDLPVEKFEKLASVPNVEPELSLHDNLISEDLLGLSAINKISHRKLDPYTGLPDAADEEK